MRRNSAWLDGVSYLPRVITYVCVIQADGRLKSECLSTILVRLFSRKRSKPTSQDSAWSSSESAIYLVRVSMYVSEWTPILIRLTHAEMSPA